MKTLEQIDTRILEFEEKILSAQEEPHADFVITQIRENLRYLREERKRLLEELNEKR